MYKITRKMGEQPSTSTENELEQAAKLALLPPWSYYEAVDISDGCEFSVESVCQSLRTGNRVVIRHSSNEPWRRGEPDEIVTVSPIPEDDGLIAHAGGLY